MQVNLNTLKAIPQAALNAANTVGKTTIKYASGAKNLAAEHIPASVKGQKNAIVGGAVILAAALSAFSIVKGVVNKIKEAKAQKQ
ncbi:MAG: hypothetical protein IJ877_00685 [Candidatus Gastranaerophilales bacterium]|nr:hypothetical protein [Candidatus Gastranaerophilales bacterium]